MKVLLVLLAVVVAANAVPGDPWASQNPWQQQNQWPNPWQQNQWQDPWQQQPIVKQILQPVKAYPVHHHQPQHIEAHFIPQQPPIPPLHPQPLKLKVHNQVNNIPYHYPKIGHPHLIGYEVAVHEPEVKHVVKPVHHAPVHHSSW